MEAAAVWSDLEATLFGSCDSEAAAVWSVLKAPGSCRVEAEALHAACAS